MCSVVGCGSWRRSALQFKLPEDPELRLEWVQFVFEANEQRLNESSWTDITVCSEHFTDDCFERPSLGTSVPGWVQLKPGAAPSLCVKSEPDDGSGCREPLETKDATFQCDDIKSLGKTGSPARPVSDQMHQKVPNADSNENKASLLQTEVCPSCGCRLETEKVTYGVLVVLNQRCLQCDYKYQWKSQVDASIPTAEEQHLTGEVKVEVVPETKQETDEDPSGSIFPTIVIYSDEDGDASDGEKGGDGVGVNADREWNPPERVSLAEEPKRKSEEEGSDQLHQNAPKVDLNKKKAAPRQKKRRHMVNESCLFQLFRRKCPSCRCKLETEKVTYRVLVVLNQRCLQCDYKYQWKSKVDASIPTAEEVTPETPQETDGNSRVFSEIITFSDEDSDPSEGEEEGHVVKVNSDKDWIPRKKLLPAEELPAEESEEEDEEEEEGEEEEEEGEEEEEEEEGRGFRGRVKLTELCTECGSFFSPRKHHTCEHKIKPYSCNICGKRCVTEKSLKSHSRIHDATYDHPCKYCYVTFKTKLDKIKHEQFHRDKEDHYKCPDCPESFRTFFQRRIHLTQNHKTVKEHKCGVCGFKFKDVNGLRRHSAVHTGLKPFQCSLCQRGFTQSSHLKSHMRLHTGERPFHCRHCDQSFNHNVSLKSHVQRYHPASSEEGKTDERASAEEGGSGKGSDSEVDCVQQPGEEEGAEVGTNAESSTVRPKGRPKRKASGSSPAARRRKGKRPNAKKVKKTGSSEEEQSDADVPFDSVEEEGARKRTARSGGRKKDDSDTDFDPEEVRKKNPEKRRGRPTKKVSARKQSKHTEPQS